MSTILESARNKSTPQWLNGEGLHTINNGYLLKDETPVQMYERVSIAAAKRLKRDDLAEKFFDYIYKGWLCLATPVASNMGTQRGLPISCYCLSTPDSISGIFTSIHELAMMSKNGGGVAFCMSNVRGRGAPITNNGFSEGVIPWAKCYDSTTIAVSQGSTRRGASAVYLDINHTDVEEFLRIRRPSGDINRQCLNLHHGVVIDNEFMAKVNSGDIRARKLWLEVLKTRFETGEPYILFSDNVNDTNPECYKKLGLKVESSNLCCLPGEELVLTKDGSFPIKDLVGKEVTIFDGKTWTTVNSFRSFGKANEFIKVSLSDGSSFRITPNHRVPLESGNIVFANALKIGDKILTNNVTEPGKLKVDGAYIKGFLVGDGTHVNNIRPLLWLYSTKYMCENRLLNSLEELPKEDINTNCIETPEFLPSGENRKTMQGLTARKSQLLPWTTGYKKCLPIDIYNWTNEAKYNFIAGVLDADGTTSSHKGKTTGIQIASINKQWLLDFQLLLKTLGVYCSINLMREGGTEDFNDGYGPYPTKDCYRITISTTSARKLVSMCRFERIKYIEIRKGIKKLYNTKPRFPKIMKIERIKGGDEVYCCNVPTTSLFALTNGLMTGNSEIILHTDSQHSFVCCLSSLNLSHFDEWRNTDLVETSIWFLDAVMSEFIEKTEGLSGFERANRFAKKSRALGLGALGWHTYLQSKMIPFDSLRASISNKVIFKTIRNKAELATKELASVYGEPEWCKGFNRRNTHLLALAPTVSNSAIIGVSPSIEPIAGNAFTKKTAKGTFLYKNKLLESLLESKSKSTDDVWKSIITEEGSVQQLDFLDTKEKEVFLTAREINQMAIIKQAADRQKFIDQSQSLNLFFPVNVDPKWFNKIHLEAHKLGIKTLYYCRTGSVLKGDVASRFYSESCTSCQG